MIKNRDYKKEYLVDDFLAGLTVAIVALPLAMAFAIASGVSPEKGIYTAIVAGILMSVFGGSKFAIGGSTGAFVVILYDIVMKFGYEGLAVATIMAGIILILMGIFQFGSIIKFIPYPVITGFTSGIALIIFSSQIKDFLGLNIENLPSELIPKIISIFNHMHETNLYAILIGVLSILLIIYTKKVFPKVPGPIIAVIFGIVLIEVFSLPIDTIESKFGEIPNTLPTPTFAFDITIEKIKLLIPSALTIALLAAIESLLCAVVADGMTGDRHKSNTELISQGIGNIIATIFGGISATGAIARSATNIKANAKSPLAGIFHGIILFLFMYLFASIIVKVPLVTLAAILIVVSYNMSEIKHFKSLLKAPRSDVLVLVLTFLLTVLVNLTV
ncbi:MAG: sodium-independent anion transporter, partial [Campylobacterales bacterium]|nr:sodium-independent anion transporter [Campylobacterales bacterium]